MPQPPHVPPGAPQAGWNGAGATGGAAPTGAALAPFPAKRPCPDGAPANCDVSDDNVAAIDDVAVPEGKLTPDESNSGDSSAPPAIE